jgi:hypothetical protein
VQFVRSLGAGRSIGIARDDGRMLALRLRSDDRPRRKSGGDGLLRHRRFGPNIRLPLQPCHPALSDSLNSSVPTQYLQIGTICGANMCLPGALLRTKSVTIRRSGLGAWPPSQLSKELPDLLEAISRLPDMGLKAGDWTM